MKAEVDNMLQINITNKDIDNILEVFDKALSRTFDGMYILDTKQRAKARRTYKKLKQFREESKSKADEVIKYLEERIDYWMEDLKHMYEAEEKTQKGSFYMYIVKDQSVIHELQTNLEHFLEQFKELTKDEG